MPHIRATAALAISALSGAAAATLQLVLNGKPAAVGSYDCTTVSSLQFVNAAASFIFQQTAPVVDAPTTPTLRSAVINNIELISAETSTSYYVDASGGKQQLICDTLQVLRTDANVIEAALIDSLSNPLRHEHHIIMTPDVAGLWGFDVMNVTQDFQLNEVRLNTRWDRCLLNHPYQFERGNDTQQPTYAYLDTQFKVQDETWRVDGRNNASLPCLTDNEGGLPDGFTYTKYNWALYHHESPYFGHYGHGVGAWFVPLGGVTDGTSAANYGVGPNHQDLAIHQDALILNYMGANHYGLPAFAVGPGFQRFYGPWLTFLTSSDPADPSSAIAAAAPIAAAAIAASITGLPFIVHPMYAPTNMRANVTGVVNVTDGRPSSNLWVLLSTQATEDDVYMIHEPTFFVRTASDGSFLLPGIPWDTYSVYIFAAGGSIVDVYRAHNVSIKGAQQVDLGLLSWTPATWFDLTLWQIGTLDRSGGEFALGNEHRAWLLPGGVPGNLDFTIGASKEDSDWYYAQTQGGTWNVHFSVASALVGTGYVLVSASLTDGYSPTPALNGDATVFLGWMPNGTDSTLSRQAVRSGYPRASLLSFDASLLKVGANTLSFSRPAAPNGSNNTGMGWDTLIMGVNVTAN